MALSGAACSGAAMELRDKRISSTSGHAKPESYPAAIARKARVKRTIDLSISIAALILLAPLMLLIAILIKIFDPGPIFYSQQRIGLNGRAFKCLKFRSMAHDADERLADLLENDAAARKLWQERQKLINDPRITPFGRFLRVSSLDELPQFINVLRGEMSVVGPRPIVHDEGLRYGRYLADYCRVKPGLTGMWQVSGRNDTTYQRRIALDVFYSRNWSFALDLWVMLRTPIAILSREGVY
ncbi:MAG: sugar transferase [Pseudomonadota bacterium]